MEQRPLPHPGDPRHRGRPNVARHPGADLQQLPTITRVAIERMQQLDAHDALRAQHRLRYQQPPPPMQQQPPPIPPLLHQEQQQQVQGQLRHQEFQAQQPLSEQQPEEEEEEEEEEQQQPPQQQLEDQPDPIADDGQEEEEAPQEEEEQEEQQQRAATTAVKMEVKEEVDDDDEDDDDDDEVVAWSSKENTVSKYLKQNFVSKIKVREEGVPENAPWKMILLKGEMLASLTYDNFALMVLNKLCTTATLDDYCVVMTYFGEGSEWCEIDDNDTLANAIIEHDDKGTVLHLTVKITRKINAAPPTAAPAAAAAAAPADVAPAASAARLPAALDDGRGHAPSPSHQGRFLMETQARTVTPEDDRKKAAVEQSGKSDARKKPAVKPSEKPRTRKKPAVKQPEATTSARKKQRTSRVTIHGTPLAAEGDKDKLSQRMAFVRKHCLVWHLASKSADVKKWNKCHNNKIVLNQVGIECAACRDLPISGREQYSLQFPSSDKAIRKCISSFMNKHFYECDGVEKDIKQKYAKLSNESPRNGVSDHIAETATECSLVFKKGGVFMM